MKLRWLLVTVAGPGLVMLACERDQTLTPQESPDVSAVSVEALAEQLVGMADWPIDEAALAEHGVPLVGEQRPHNVLMGFEREVIIDDIAHYTVQVRVGEGPYDVIGLHRIVREQSPYRPIRTDEAIFLVHGSSGLFNNGFLDPATSPDKASSVVFARNDIDVWGIDMGWSLVPQEETDTSIFEGWGIQKDIDHLDVALGIARFTRAFTGSSFRQLDLLGHSYGATVTYAYAGFETQLPPGLRHVKGIIPVDIYVKTDDPDIAMYLCDEAADLQADLDAEIYASNRTLIYTMAELARTAPDDPSPVLGWLNNWDAAIAVGTSTLIFTPNTEWYHLLGGVFEEGRFPLYPQGLAYTDSEVWLVKMEGFSFYLPNQAMLDLWGMGCESYDSPLDDHLGDITIPVFYVGAAGGFGDTGLYTTTLLGSTDITTYVVSVDPDITVDYGHNDLFMADSAVELAYQPIMDWMAAR